MKYQKERIADCTVDATMLGAMHWREVMSGPFRLNMVGYINHEQRGKFAYYTARTDTGEIAGQAGFCIWRSNNSSRVQAVDDFYYVVPAHRNGFTAVRLLRCAINDLKVGGVDDIMLGHMVSRDLGPLLQRLGMVEAGAIYTFSNTMPTEE